MSVFLSPVGGAGAQFFDNNGNPLTGGKLYTYAAGTTTPQATYTSAAGATFHTNPIILDAAGRVPGSSEIWLADSQIYKFVLKDSNDVLLATWDQITGVNSNFVNYTTETEVQTATAGQTVFTLTTMSYAPGTGSLTVYVDGVNQYEGTSYAETNSTTVTFTAGLHVGALVKFTTAVQTTGNATDASVVTYNPPFTGAVATTVQDKLRQTVSVKDFGAVGDGVTDDTAAFQDAINSAVANQCDLFVPNGEYLITSTLFPDYVPGNENPSQRDHSIKIYGQNSWTTIIKFTGTGYFIDYQSGVPSDKYLDAVFVQGLQVVTSTGGGLAIPAGGAIYIKDFFMNGCGAAYYGIYIDGSFSSGVGAYNIDIDDCRFWSNTTSYQGGAVYINNFLSASFRNSFVSKIQKDGAITFFSHGRNLELLNVMIENPDAPVSNQVGVQLGANNPTDTIFSSRITNCYFEGILNTCIKLGGTPQYNVYVQDAYVNFFDGQPVGTFLDASTSTSHFGIKIDGLTYFCGDSDSPGSALIVSDQYNRVSLERAFNASVAPAQIARGWINSVTPQRMFGNKESGVVKVTSSNNLPSFTHYKWTGTGQTYYAKRDSLDASGNYKIGVAATAALMGAETITDVVGVQQASQTLHFLNSANETTGGGTASFGTANCPATTTTAVFKWLTVTLSDGSTVHIPTWK